jgi:hypothetical protein
MTLQFETDLSRRLFLRGTGGGLLLGSALAAAGPAFAQTSGASGGMDGLPPSRPSGRPMPEMEKAMPETPDRRLGYAVVGLGQFALNQIIPSFAESKSSKLVALVSGNRDKATGSIRRTSTITKTSIASPTTMRSTSSTSSCRMRYTRNIRSGLSKLASMCCARSPWLYRPRNARP